MSRTKNTPMGPEKALRFHLTQRYKILLKAHRYYVKNKWSGRNSHHYHEEMSKTTNLQKYNSTNANSRMD